MKFNYALTRDRASELIKRFGQRGEIRKVTQGTGTNPWDPGVEVSIKYPIDFALIDYTLRERENSQIQQKDKKALVSASVEISDVNQLVEQNGAVWEIIDLQPLAPAGLVVLYTIQVRQ